MRPSQDIRCTGWFGPAPVRGAAPITRARQPCPGGAGHPPAQGKRARPAKARSQMPPGHNDRRDMAEGDRQLKPMTRQQALDKLASAPFGRVVFTEHALPALRQVNHLIDHGRIIIRSHPGRGHHQPRGPRPRQRRPLRGRRHRPAHPHRLERHRHRPGPPHRRPRPGSPLQATAPPLDSRQHERRDQHRRRDHQRLRTHRHPAATFPALRRWPRRDAPATRDAGHQPRRAGRASPAAWWSGSPGSATVAWPDEQASRCCG
jgi:hypothetical protein